MQLGTFGAILTFAMELEERAAAFYEEGARGPMKATFSDLARSSRKRLSRLERNRREGVAEMILESITGLDGDDYPVELEAGANDAERLRQAKALEEISARFYAAAAEKMPVREVSRTLERMAQDNQKRRAELAEAG